MATVKKTIKKAQSGRRMNVDSAVDAAIKQVSIPKKLASKGADKRISKAFESAAEAKSDFMRKKYNDSSVLKSTKTYKAGGKVSKKK